MGYLRTTFLLAAMTALVVGVGGLIGGQAGLLIALVVAGGMNVFAYWNSDKMVLSMHGARPADDGSAPQLTNMVHRLADQAGLPRPRVYIMDNPQPNAFATGRNPHHAAVAATTGLLKALTPDEVEGVMAHELAHIKNRDTLTMTITATLAGAISMLANFALFFGGNRNNPLGLVGTILVMILAPIAAMLVQMAISRTREYAADKTGAEICGRPTALASALAKISNAGRRIPNEQAEANPATAHLFISNPLSGRALAGLFSTHPPMDERISRLNRLVGEMMQHPAPRTHARGRVQSGASGIPPVGRSRRGPWG